MPNSPTLTLRNYRCFDWNNPATISLSKGFTAIIGPNNSGKSSALRAIYELRNHFPNFLQALSPLQNNQFTASFLGVTDPSELANEKDDRCFQVEISIPKPEAGAHLLSIAVSFTFEFDTRNNVCKGKKVTVIKPNGEELHLNEQDLKSGTPSGQLIIYSERNIQVNFKEILSFCSTLASARYFPAFRNAINEGASNYYDIPVGTALVANWDLWKAGISKSHKKSIIKVEKEIALLLGFKSLEINADQNGKSLDVTIDGRPHKLYEVGSGVAQLIIVIAAALIANATYILIDEPELNLHPALQINFLAALGSYASVGLLYSTHSIGLARSTADTIYSTKRLDDGSSSIEKFGDPKINFTEWLGELNYSSRSELGCDGILLVEGPTDVLIFQEFLRKLKKDARYIVMQLGGSSLINSNISTHISEISRLIDSRKIRVFIDSEKKYAEDQLAKDRIDFISECEKFGITAHVSTLRATENYFLDKNIQSALGNEYKALGPYQLLKDLPKKWSKSENWKIARETSFSDIQDTDLGKFLLSL